MISSQLPPILGEWAVGTGWHLELDINAALECFEGHFPDLPIVPGVVQVDWAIHLAVQKLNLAPMFHRLSLIKFMRVIQPPRVIGLELRGGADGTEMAFRYFDVSGDFSSGRASFKHE